MIIFYTENIENNIAIFEDQEAVHCSKVLRKRVGDKVVFTDGKGFFYEGIVNEINRKSCSVNISKKEPGNKLPYNLTIAISPTKNISRYEWFLEKAVEIGVSKIVPIITERTQRNKFKQDRLQNIINSASKQSLKATFPDLCEKQNFKDYITSLDPDNTFLAHLMPKSIFLGKAIKSKLNYTILIGPEGDFTKDEIDFCLNKGIKAVTLGSSRLRTETAGVVATQIISTVNELEL